MVMRIIDAILNGAVDVMADAPDAGGGANGVVQVWSGSPPGTITGAPAGDLLAEIDLDNPAFNAGGTTNPGEAEGQGVPITTTGLADGTIGFIRVLDTDQLDADALWDDDDVGTSGTRVIFNTLTVAIGVDFSLDSYVLSAVPTTA